MVRFREETFATFTTSEAHPLYLNRCWARNIVASILDFLGAAPVSDVLVNIDRHNVTLIVHSAPFLPKFSISVELRRFTWFWARFRDPDRHSRGVCRDLRSGTGWRGRVTFPIQPQLVRRSPFLVDAQHTSQDEETTPPTILDAAIRHALEVGDGPPPTRMVMPRTNYIAYHGHRPPVRHTHGKKMNLHFKRASPLRSSTHLKSTPS